MRFWQFAVGWTALFVIALSSGVELLSYLSYVLLFAGGAMWIVSRLTLEGLAVRRSVGQAYAHLGDTIELRYELENSHRLSKLWLEIFEESNWPEPLPGRVLSIAGGGTRKWKVLVKALRRGRFRVGPIVLRSGDPFGVFPNQMKVDSHALVLVYPKVVALPHWQLPGSFLEGNVLTGQRSLQSTSMVMGIREYRSGDAVNRIHWPSSVRHRTLQVKEFELDKTADLWIYVDLERHWHRGEGEDATIERAVTVAASVVAKALREHRNVGMVTSGVRAEVLQPDRGTKQFGKLMQYLAEVQVGGSRTLAETMVETLPRLRRGASCLLVTPSLDRAWVRPASTMRESGISTQAVIVAPPAETDERDRARRHALLGELAVAGVRAAYLAPGTPVEDLFRETQSVVA
ncbi:MAG TPA: DUF58 domain-containing protein [Candidatus Limnocylindrales bacterium]|nr:DUF58 domain-containing protein [Candidatus Limnocylindrales bacterium]